MSCFTPMDGKIVKREENSHECKIHFVVMSLRKLMATCKQQCSKQYAIDSLEHKKVRVNTIEQIIWEEMLILSKQFIAISLNFCLYLSPVPISNPEQLLKLATNL